MNVDFRRKVAVSLACLLLIFCTTYALGQGVVTGSVSGTVVDPQGAVIVGAKVTATNIGTNQSASDLTNNNGAYSIRQLPPGSYNVTITAANFQTLSIKGVDVKAGLDSAMGAQKMAVGATTETVTVEATVPLVESTTAQISTTFENKQITDLPIGSAFDALVLLTPGAASTGDAGFSNTNGAGISMNGQRGRSNNFQIDGQSNNDNSVAGPSVFLENQDVIAEYQVINNNFSAEYGRNMGSVINYITKSGTNSLHGTAFWFYQGSWLSSRANQDKSPLLGFCVPPATSASTLGACEDSKVPRFDDHRVGATIGGPLKKNRAWFFASYLREWFRQGATPSSSGTSITPTPAGLATLAAAFPGNVPLQELQLWGPYGIPGGNPSPTGTPVTLCVSPSGAACVPVEFSAVTRFLPSSFNDNDVTGRIDVQVTDKDRFFGRYIYQDFNTANATGRRPQGMVVGVPGRSQQIGLDWVHTFTDHFINQVRFSFSRAGFGFEGGTVADCLRSSIFLCPSGVSFSSAGTNLTFGMQNNLPQGRLVNNSQWQDNASWVHGRHTIKFGGEYSRQRSPNVFLPNINGTFTFRGNNSGSFQNLCSFYNGSAPGGTPSATLCGFDRFLANDVGQLALTDGPSAFGFKEQDGAVYVQDSWRWKDNVTLNFGVRWEFYGQATNLLHDLTVARETGPNPFWDTTLSLDRRTIHRVSQDTNNWGPNVGFTYTPRVWESLFGRDKTVIRGGFRIAYDPEYYNIFLNVATAAPVVNAGTILCTPAPCANPAPLPTGGATGATLRAAGYLGLIPRGSDPGFRLTTRVTDNFHNPYAEQWNFGIQREITSKIALEVNYVGNHTVGNFQTLNANPFLGPIGGGVGSGIANDFPALVPAGITQCATAGQPGFDTRPNCDNTLFRLRANTAWSTYHGLQSELRIQNWHGWTGAFTWTWSHAIDNVSEIFSTGAAGNGVAGPMNFFNSDQPERGTGGTSYTHVISIWWIYELPWYKSQAGFLGKALGGWQLNGIYRYRSGEAFNPLQGISSVYCDINWNATFYGIDTCRPILNDPSAPIDTVGIYNSACNLVDPFAAGTTQFHWVFNNTRAALCLNNPFAGVGRNSMRAQTFNNLDFGVYKNFKMGERLTMQIQANGFNVLNRQYRGTPDPFLDDGGFSTVQSSFMNNFFNDSNNRNFTFGLRFIF